MEAFWSGVRADNNFWTSCLPRTPVDGVITGALIALRHTAQRIDHTRSYTTSKLGIRAQYCVCNVVTNVTAVTYLTNVCVAHAPAVTNGCYKIARYICNSRSRLFNSRSRLCNKCEFFRFPQKVLTCCRNHVLHTAYVSRHTSPT